MSRIDLLLLHPPSVYDFRRHAILYGPVSDLIPSSPVFEMYPLGFLTLTDYLEARGFSVRIVNLALRMMNDREFDVPTFLSRLQPRAVGIDLHWLPHAHGSIEIAKLVKQIHPHVTTIFGGLSASYFHRELIEHPAVDYVMRGDSVEPPMHQLLTILNKGGEPGTVPNLTWKSNGLIHENPPDFRPTSLDYVDLSPDRMIRMVLRYRDLQSVLPFNGWLQNPITAVFTVKGCHHECVTCGSSRQACATVSKRTGPLFRSPTNLVQNMTAISRFSKGPIFLVGDLRQAGEDHALEVLSRLKKARLRNQIVFELFEMPPPGYLRQIDRAVANWSLELSPESHDPAIRRLQDSTTFFSNHAMEAIIDEALELHCQRIDVFFMIGLPRQTRNSVRESVSYCGQLFANSDRRLSCFISPMGPFLDPGSQIFEHPEQFGYHLFAHSLEEHRQLLVQPSWKQILNYETNWMSRDDLVEATYDTAEVLNQLKLRHGRIPKARGEAVARRIQRARALKHRLDALPPGQSPDQATYRELLGDIHEFSVSTVCDKRELFWRRHLINFKPGGILRAGLRRSPDIRTSNP